MSQGHLLTCLTLLLLSIPIAKPRSKPILQNGLPRNATAKVGDNATMECNVLVSGTLPDFRWLKWDKSITSQPKMNNETLNGNGLYKLIDPHYYKFIQVGERHGVQLNINNVDDDDFGLYTCYVSNYIGFAYSSALLMKYEEPSSPSGKPKIFMACLDVSVCFFQAAPKKKNVPGFRQMWHFTTS